MPLPKIDILQGSDKPCQGLDTPLHSAITRLPIGCRTM